MSFCGEDGVPEDGKNHGRVGATVVAESFEENADACLEEGDLEGPQSRASVEVEVLKTFHLFVLCLHSLHLSPMSVTVRPRLYPLASLSQIQSTPSAQDDVPYNIEEDLRAYGCKLIHQAGILLNQSVSFLSSIYYPPHTLGDRKQVAVATAQILLQRFFYVSSLKQFSVAVRPCCLLALVPSDSSQDIGMGALYLSSKLEECPVRMRDLINVYDLLLQRAAHTVASASFTHSPPEFKYAPMSYFGNTFYDLREALVVSEMQILKRLGFDVQVVLPYGTLVNYMRLLGLTSRNEAVSMAWGYLNDGYV